MLDLGWTLEAMPDETAPFRKIGRATKILRVVLQRFPANEKTIAARFLDGTLQFHAGAAFRAPKQWRCLRDASLELSFHARLYVDLSDLEDHEYNSFEARSRKPLAIWIKGKRIVYQTNSAFSS
jgi:hypothetical protein